MSEILPVARTAKLVVEIIDDETVVYDLERHKAHSLNAAATLLWNACDGETTLSEATALLARELDLPADPRVVELGLRELARAQLVVAPGVGEKPVSRRALVGRLALTGSAAALLPAVMSVIAPTPAEAATMVTPTQCANPANWGKCCQRTPSQRRKCMGGTCSGTPC